MRFDQQVERGTVAEFKPLKVVYGVRYRVWPYWRFAARCWIV